MNTTRRQRATVLAGLWLLGPAIGAGGIERGAALAAETPPGPRGAEQDYCVLPIGDFDGDGQNDQAVSRLSPPPTCSLAAPRPFPPI